MKFKISVIAIILSTAALIGLIKLAVNKTVEINEPPRAQIRKNKEHVGKDDHKTHSSFDSAREKTADHEERRRNDPTELISGDAKPATDTDGFKLSKEDEKKINGVASLSEAELAKELDTLKSQIDEEDLFGRLESGDLSAEKVAEAKEMLERFALLGLEGTRRKYLSVEPELKDALYAHGESLKEIRELLND
jgi:hypothetical protein